MNPLPDEPLELAILLYKNMQNCDVAGGQLSGTLSLEIDFAVARQRLEATDAWIAGQEATRQVELHLPPSFFLSVDALLIAPERRIKAPDRFYLADLEFLFDGNSAVTTPVIKNYLDAAKLFSLLSQVADHRGGIGSAKTLVFVHKDTIEIEPKYTANDLCELPDLDGFGAEFVESQTHKEQKATIIKTVLMDMFPGRRRVPLSELLHAFGEFVDKVHASYQLYVSEFSFQKVKAEIEKEKLDATIKLNKVFSDIQNQLLAVPAALLLTGGQIENTHEWSGKNAIIWLGVLIFAVLMTLLVRNQRHTLRAVKLEIDQQWEQIKAKPTVVADRFNRSYKELELRYRHQARLIIVVDLLVALALAIATGMLLYVSVSRDLMHDAMTYSGVAACIMFAYVIMKWLYRRFCQLIRR